MDGDSVPQPVRRLGYFNAALSLCTVDFPIFYIESISERHVVIAGGGGLSKTGVYNQIMIVELSPSNGSCFATFVAKNRDIPDAIMTGSLMRDLPIARTRLVVGGTQPAIYQLSYESTNKRFNIRKHENLKDDAFLSDVKCVKYASGSIFAGGTDGHLTVWQDTTMTSNIKAHEKEIDEIDVDETNGRVLTLSRGEGRLVIWNLSNLESVREYTNKDFNRIAGVTYCMRSCKYASEANKKGSVSSLIIACNPIPAKNQACQLHKISIKGNEMSVILDKQVNIDGVMAMTIRSDGRYLAVGTRSGGVVVLSTKNFAPVYEISNAHYNAVTGLEFLPPTHESLALTNSKLCPLLSVSIDRRLVMHRPHKRSLPMRWLKYVIIMLVIYLLLYFVHKYVLS